jgi:hypothetical protein
VAGNWVHDGRVGYVLGVVAWALLYLGPADHEAIRINARHLAGFAPIVGHPRVLPGGIKQHLPLPLQADV